MNPRILFVVEGDPRTSGRPAEAVRIAAGVAAWKKTRISLYLRNQSILALAEYTDELVDEDVFTRFMPMIGETGGSVYVQAGSPWLNELGEPRLAIEEISDLQLAAICAQHQYVLRFGTESIPNSPPEPGQGSPWQTEPKQTNHPKSLHLLTRPNDPLSRAIIPLQVPGTVADLSVAEPDYNALVDALFDADSIQVW